MNERTNEGMNENTLVLGGWWSWDCTCRGRPVLDVAGAVNDSILLPILWGSQAAAVPQVTKPAHGHGVHLGIAVLHPTDEPSPRPHAEPHRCYRRVNVSNIVSYETWLKLKQLLLF